MTKEDMILGRLKEIVDGQTAINAKLDAGQNRMSDIEKDIIKLQLSRNFAAKQMAGLWLMQILVMTGFLTSYYNLVYTKPKSPIAPIRVVQGS